jgi:hypothetical protein
VLKVLTVIILQITKSEEKADLRKKIEDFEVVVVMQNKMLTIIHTVSKLLQSEKTGSQQSFCFIESAYEDFKLYRNDFESVVQTPTDTAKSWGYQTGVSEK